MCILLDIDGYEPYLSECEHTEQKVNQYLKDSDIQVWLDIESNASDTHGDVHRGRNCRDSHQAD